MKDKKFVVLCILAGIWLILFIGMLAGELRVNRNVELFVTFICVAWFAYWTVSILRTSGKKKKVTDSSQPVEEPLVADDNTNSTQTNDESKKAWEDSLK